MITNLSIQNFKSIIKTNVRLKPLTVIVGANGTGKSNLIKSIDFIASIARNGLLGAVDQFGRYESIIPKAIPKNRIKKTNVNIKYQVRLPRIVSYESDQPIINVKHAMELAYSKVEPAHMYSEILEYEKPLSVAEIYSNDFKEEKINKDLLEMDSCFKLKRGPRGAIKYDSSPSFSEDIPRYLDWLGLRMFKKNIHSKSALIELLKYTSSVGRSETSIWNQRYESFLDPGNSRYTGFAVQADIFRRQISGAKRYDLLLSELRPEQQAGNTSSITSAGKNIPSVLRRLKNSGGKSWNRLMKTMKIIAPHVTNVNSDRLRTGKEFVEFTENVARRNIESWESSDGTLRALAIIIAMETHKQNSILLLEEPEQNLHPWAVRELMEHMREVIDERGLQIILTTHSPQVLERVEPDEVLVAQRTSKSGTIFNKLEDMVPNNNIIMGDIARLWVKGLIGGVPSDVR